MNPAVRTVVRSATRRTFSNLSSLRAAGKPVEHYPFERVPVTQKAAKADWGHEVRRVGSHLLLFVPAAALMLGWPFMVRRVIRIRAHAN